MSTEIYVLVTTIILILPSVASDSGYFRQRAFRCPSPNSLHPCNCTATTVNYQPGQIRCESLLYTGHMIKQIFQEVGRELSLDTAKQSTVAGRFELVNSLVEDIVSDSFERMAFAEIHLKKNDYLKTIDVDAFRSSYLITDKLILEENRQLAGSYDQDKAVFELLSRFRNVSFVWVIDCGLRTVPESAFRGQFNRLEILSLANNRIAVVGPKAFLSLKSVRFINLRQNQIERLENESLRLEPIANINHRDDDNRVHINLAENRLTGESLAVNSLAAIGRPVELDLTNNFITFLNEPVFLPLFRRPAEVRAFDNPLTCANCSMQWLVREETCHGKSLPDHHQHIQFNCLDDPFKRRLRAVDYINCPINNRTDFIPAFFCPATSGQSILTGHLSWIGVWVFVLRLTMLT